MRHVSSRTFLEKKRHLPCVFEGPHLAGNYIIPGDPNHSVDMSCAGAWQYLKPYCIACAPANFDKTLRRKKGNNNIGVRCQLTSILPVSNSSPLKIGRAPKMWISGRLPAFHFFNLLLHGSELQPTAPRVSTKNPGQIHGILNFCLRRLGKFPKIFSKMVGFSWWWIP